MPATNLGKPRPTPGSLLAKRRADLGLTLQQVAAKAGIAYTTVGAYERGRSLHPDPDHFARYAAALDLTVTEALRLMPQYVITPWGGNPFSRRGRHKVFLSEPLAQRAHRACREWDRRLDDLVAEALERELDRLDGVTAEDAA
ncbi:MAG TPA: helix-turn-helix transcriptional regulator [Rhodothermales bacterium]|nr:helix-turn-helix transcriptional regulator [Rhodothermales bacterium]